MGLIYHSQRKYDEALNYHQQALRILEKYYSSEHVLIADSIDNIANILSDQSKYEEAVDFYQRALNVRERLHLSNHVKFGRGLYNIGVSYENVNKSTIALEYYQRALIIYEKCLPNDDQILRKTEQNISRLVDKIKPVCK